MSIKSHAIASLVAIALGAGIAMPLTMLPALAAEQPVAPEKNPPGDIPDSQVFIDYAGSSFAMQVPEGWTRVDLPDGARFSDKYNIVSITATPGTPPTLTDVTKTEVPRLENDGRAVAVGSIKEVPLPSAGKAIRIEYQSNSEPNEVTGKQVRLEHARYIYAGRGLVVTLDMAAPQGADNVDQWRFMADSVRVK